MALGIVAAGALGLSTGWRTVTSVLVAWDVAVAVYTLLAFQVVASSSIEQIRRRAAHEDEGRSTILMLTVAAAVVSIVAIFVELRGPGGAGQREPVRLILAGVTILLSWTLIHTVFALHYAHEFYDESAARGMAFPGGDERPDYWDFVYFAFVIGMTSQVSDVGVTDKRIRRTVAAHGVVSFLFNVALLALTVNIAASAI
jgi:uncharacterized membrane protein